MAAQINTFPLIIRPAFTMGGAGGGIAYNQEELERIAQEVYEIIEERLTVERESMGL